MESTRTIPNPLKVKEKGRIKAFSGPPTSVGMECHSVGRTPHDFPPPMAQRPAILSYRRREARRSSPMSFAVFTIVVVVSVLVLLILVKLVARRWLL